ncbi:ankyrin repeat domain-containing protein [Hymenobacter nivis]|uniref:Ankyrin repeat domain-containing protein n=1 Tax=Hymenobacter nivis TaxID=1850093 RepID=A0A502GCS1_9BACT|nr:ankyrin repeat domain-containing protein [Hymenobacter nivis]TPG59462.1 ankyrin repeat domain-containing protein [Hymenobacter nivis]
MKKLLFLIGALFAAGCSEQSQDLLGDDVKLFASTKAWLLAQAVSRDDTTEIYLILSKNHELINAREPKFGQTLLSWAIYTNHYSAAKALLQHGANPNIRDLHKGITPLINAADKYETSAYVKLLIDYKANPNLAATDSTESHATPLISAAYNRLESVKLLIDAGATVNYEAPYHKSALYAAFTRDRVDIVRYLIIEQGADIKRPITYRSTYDGKEGAPVMVTDLLRNWVFPLDSENYKEKMAIVSYLKLKGEYRKTDIPE